MDRDKHRIVADGLRHDGVPTYPADAHDMALSRDCMPDDPAPRLPAPYATGISV